MSNELLLRRRMMMQSKKDNILTFTAAADNSSVKLAAVGSPTAISLEYKTRGNGWSPYTIGDVISLPRTGDYVKMRGVNDTFSIDNANYYKYFLTGSIAATGDVTSLQNNVGGAIALTPYCYANLFQNCDKLTQAPALPSTKLDRVCYASMFLNCVNLVQPPPSLPSIALAPYCYNAMFQSCNKLTQAPVLPATTLAENCYRYMFYGCKRITSHDVAMLNTSQQVFDNNSSCASFTIHAEIPPTISNYTIKGLKADCKIYVPYSVDHSILDAYKTAKHWSVRAEYMYELDENGEIPE
jgi:hypothetical protein